MSLLAWWLKTDALTQVAALVLLAMSVMGWVVILWKARQLRRASADLPRCLAAFWQAPDLAAAAQKLEHFDREALVLPMVLAAKSVATQTADGSLATSGARAQRLTRALRDALHGVLARLQWGQVLLATAGATAPFVGLLGTVWGIYHALRVLAQTSSTQVTLAQLAGPVGESLVMTAAGLAVAIPAVLAYNGFGRVLARIEADLEGFALDLRELLADGAPGVAEAPDAPGVAASAPAASAEAAHSNF